MSDRKADHIELAFQSQMGTAQQDDRFNYEPMLSGYHNELPAYWFDNKKLGAPIWVSSMTGGTEKAYAINQHLAAACAEFGLGMGLGSCRPLLNGKSRFNDFNLRPIIGPDLPFYANLGIAQVSHLIHLNRQQEIVDLVADLHADGLIVHVNPLQEWLQPEGDRYAGPPVQVVEQLWSTTGLKVIVKEVGQGFGPDSLLALMKMPLVAIDFAALGGTNFALLEMLRSSEAVSHAYSALAQVGHSANQMIDMTNQLFDSQVALSCHTVIVSGGIRNFLDGYYCINKIKTNAVYGQASMLLRYAQESYQALREYLVLQIEGLKLANAFLKVKP
jgi:isopentenyl-diphosphate delta-isomerase